MDCSGVDLSAGVYELLDGQQLAVLSAKEITTGGRHPFQLVAVIAFIGALIVLYSESC